MKAIIILALVFFTNLLQSQPWNVNPQNFEFSMNITCKVKIDNNWISDTSNYIGVFSNNECRGYAHPAEVNSDENLIFLTLYSNFVSGDTLSFKFYEPGQNEIMLNHEIKFENNAIYGTPDLPYVFDNVNINSEINFLYFSSEYQIGEALIDYENKHISLEISEQGNISQLKTDFIVPLGVTVYINGENQESGISQNNFSDPIVYTLAKNGIESNWIVNITQASHIKNNDLYYLSIYPNPSQHIIYLHSNFQDIRNISLYNSYGSLIMKNLDVNSSIDISYLSNGSYFIKTEFENKVIVSRFNKE